MDEYIFHDEADDLKDDKYDIHPSDVTREQLDEIRGAYYQHKRRDATVWWIAWIASFLLPLYIFKASLPETFLSLDSPWWSYLDMVYPFVVGWILYKIISNNRHTVIQTMIDVARLGNTNKNK
jgi:hypothetical protein